MYEVFLTVQTADLTGKLVKQQVKCTVDAGESDGIKTVKGETKICFDVYKFLPHIS